MLLLQSCFCLQALMLFTLSLRCSRSTLYPLIEQKKLPNYHQIIQRGNYRNLGMENSDLIKQHSTFLLYSGMSSDQYNDQLFVNYVQSKRPEMDVVCLFSTPIEREYLLDTQVLMMSVVEQTQSPKVDYYTSSTISDMAVDYIQKQEKPFFMMLNFTNVDYFGARYRDGADVYSKAIKNTDAALGKIINSLKEKGQFESTEFLMTTNYLSAQNAFPVKVGW